MSAHSPPPSFRKIGPNSCTVNRVDLLSSAVSVNNASATFRLLSANSFCSSIKQRPISARGHSLRELPQLRYQFSPRDVVSPAFLARNQLSQCLNDRRLIAGGNLQKRICKFARFCRRNIDYDHRPVRTSARHEQSAWFARYIVPNAADVSRPDSHARKSRGPPDSALRPTCMSTAQPSEMPAPLCGLADARRINRPANLFRKRNRRPLPGRAASRQAPKRAATCSPRKISAARSIASSNATGFPPTKAAVALPRPTSLQTTAPKADTSRARMRDASAEIQSANRRTRIRKQCTPHR